LQYYIIMIREIQEKWWHVSFEKDEIFYNFRKKKYFCRPFFILKTSVESCYTQFESTTNSNLVTHKFEFESCHTKFEFIWGDSYSVYWDQIRIKFELSIFEYNHYSLSIYDVDKNEDEKIYIYKKKRSRAKVGGC